MKKLQRCLCCLLSLVLLLAPLTPRAMAAQSGAKLIAITYDDGPGKYTGELLDGLSERGVVATFFVNGNNAAANPDLLRRIVDEGHQLANHTYNHENLNTLSSGRIEKEIADVQSLITAAGGSDNAYIRPPYGNANQTVKDASRAPLIYWSVDPLDWKYRNRQAVYNNIVNSSYDGAIILVHDLYQTSVNGSLDAIDTLLKDGYEFVTVEQLLLRRGVDPQPGVMYYDAKNNGVNLGADEVSPQYYDETKLEQHWGYDAMRYCVEAGFLETDADGRWLPNYEISRGDFVMALGRFCGTFSSYESPSGNVFTDVEDSDARLAYILWANDAELMYGHDHRFRPDDPITREEIATVLTRYLNMTGKAQTTHGDPLTLYADRDTISDWALDGVALCTYCGILQGTEAGFSPKKHLTRAQTATILQRLAQGE